MATYLFTVLVVDPPPPPPEEAKVILEQQKAENEVKKKVEERLERYSRNMKSIVFQINKRYLARKRSPLRFVDNIAELPFQLMDNGCTLTQGHQYSLKHLVINIGL